MKKILLGIIRFYQKYLSGAKGYSSCKYYPTCSRYAIEAIEKYGAFKGGLLAAWRILQLQSFFKMEDMTLFLKKNYKIRWRKKRW